MAVLLLRLSGPLQSWDVQSRFQIRRTDREPSKSGVIGLLMAAKGWGRDHPVGPLAHLRMGVRIDQEGILLRDFHTAQNVREASAKKVDLQRVPEKLGVRDSVSNRYYLMDARFLVGLEGEDLALLADLHRALKDPVWPLYLGRKACVPGEPVWLPDGLRPNQTLEEALRTYPWLGPQDRFAKAHLERLRLMLEDPAGEIVRPDQPLSFAERERRYSPRRIRLAYCPVPTLCLEEVLRCTSPA